MLSKLDFFGSVEKVMESAAERRALWDALKRRIPQVSITPARGGTLGVCFHLQSAGSRRFLKTHLPDATSRINLANEADVLLHLYGEGVVLDCFEVTLDRGGPRLCMLMAELSPLAQPMHPTESAAMVRDFIGQLAGYRPAGLAPDRDFARYIRHALQATAVLADRGLIGRPLAADLEGLLAELSASQEALPKALCHGDFGPRNIMTDGVRAIAIDWEDVFEGVEGYDYLYWLTFMDNRHFLQTAAFGRTTLDATTERAILALVVVLKSYLSVQAGTYLQNKLSIEARIVEVLALPRVA